MINRFYHLLGCGVLVCAMLSALLLCSCEKESEHLSESQMEDMLYDLHLAQAMVQQGPVDSIDYYSALYKQSVLQKYGLTDKELEANLHYYAANGHLLAAIYARIAERLNGVDFLVNESMLTYQAGGDTLNVWNGPSNLLFVNTSRNEFTCSIEADTLILAGDRLEWRSMSSAIYSEGERNAYASVVMEYADTTEYHTRQIGGYGLQTFDVKVLEGREFQRLTLSIQQNAAWSPDVKILSMAGINLLRIRPPKPVVEEKTDSLSIEPDSIPQTDTHDGQENSSAVPSVTLR